MAGIHPPRPAVCHRFLLSDWNGVPFTRPFQRTRDTVRFLREALAGGRVEQDYETFSVRGFRLDRAPAVAPRILVAALRPGMLRLAGREADGAVLSWPAATDVPTVTTHIGSGAQVAARIFAPPSEDTDEVRKTVRRIMAGYLTAPVYRAFQESLGRGEQFAELWQRWDHGDRRGAVAAIPDEAVDALVVHGSPADCVAHINSYVDNGVTVPAILPIPVGMTTHEAALRLAP